MVKILLSPCLLDFSVYTSEKDKRIHIEEISHICCFISECLDEPEILYFYNQTNILLNILSVNYNNDTALYNQTATILSILQSYHHKVVQKNIENNIDISASFSIGNDDYSDSFAKCLKYCREKDFNGYIFIGKENKDYEGNSITNNSNMVCLRNPYTCNFNLIEDNIKDDLPFENIFFKNEKICEHTNYYFKLVEGSKSQRQEYFFSYGEIAAIRNGYIYDDKLSRLNSRRMGTRRDVYVKYSSANKPRYYISVDTEHGGLELFKDGKPHPVHKGEFNFSCKKNQKAKPLSHPLYT